MVENPRQSFVDHLESDLRHLILTQSTAVLRVAIPCFCGLAKLMGHHTGPLQLLKSFLAFLDKHAKAKTTLTVPIKKALLRSLFSCGLLVKFFNFDPVDANISDRTLKDVAGYVMHSDNVIVRTAIQSMCFGFSRKPTAILGMMKVIRHSLSDKVGVKVQVQSY